MNSYLSLMNVFYYITGTYYTCVTLIANLPNRVTLVSTECV